MPTKGSTVQKKKMLRIIQGYAVIIENRIVPSSGPLQTLKKDYKLKALLYVARLNGKKN